MSRKFNTPTFRGRMVSSTPRPKQADGTSLFRSQLDPNISTISRETRFEDSLNCVYNNYLQRNLMKLIELRMFETQVELLEKQLAYQNNKLEVMEEKVSSEMCKVELLEKRKEINEIVVNLDRNYMSLNMSDLSLHNNLRVLMNAAAKRFNTVPVIKSEDCESLVKALNDTSEFFKSLLENSAVGNEKLQLVSQVSKGFKHISELNDEIRNYHHICLQVSRVKCLEYLSETANFFKTRN